MMFFGILGIAIALGSLILAWPIITEFVETGLVPRFPTAILSTGMMVLAFLSFACGLVLDTVTLGRREMKRMSYLAIPNPMRSQAARVETASPYASQAGEKS